MTIYDGRTGRTVRGRPRKIRTERTRLGSLGDSSSDTFGGRLWEFLNPKQTQREYDLSAGAGRAPRAPQWSVGDVLDIGVENAIDAGRAARDTLFSGARWLMIAGVFAGGVYVLYLVNEMRKRKSK